MTKRTGGDMIWVLMITLLVAGAAGWAVAEPVTGPHVDSLAFRVIVDGAPDIGPSRIEATVLPTRERPIHLEPQALTVADHNGIARLVSPWQTFRVLHDAHGRIIDHALLLEMSGAAEPIPEADLIVELAEEPGEPDKVLRLRQRTIGTINTVLIPGGVSTAAFTGSRWLSEHLNDLEAALRDAGFDRGVDLGGFEFEAELNLQRFAPTPLTENPEHLAQLGRILEWTGFNRSNATGLRTHRDHFEKYLTRHHLTTDYPVYRPTDPAMLESLSAFWEAYRDRYEVGGEFADLPLPTMLKLGDEISLLGPTDTLETSPRFAELFREEAVIVTGDDPGRLGLARWDELTIPAFPTRHDGGPDAVPEAQRLAVYIALRARNRATAEMYAANTRAVHEILGGEVDTTVNMLGVLYGGGFSSLAWWFRARGTNFLQCLDT